MPDPKQDPDKGTENKPDPGTETEEQKKEKELQAVLEREDVKKALQSEADKRVAQALETERRKSQEREKAAAEKAKKEAEEKKLLDDGKLKELADLKAKEADEAKAELASLQREKNIDALLDKEMVTDPETRKLIKMLPGDLTEIKQHIDADKARITRLVEEEVNKRLGITKPPAKNGNSSDPDKPTKFAQIKTTAEKAAFITKYGNEEFQKLVDAG